MKNQIELSDDEYLDLIEKYGKIMVFKIEDEDYGIRYPNRAEFNILKKQRSASNVTDIQMLSGMEDVTSACVVFPSYPVFKERIEKDGGLLTLLTNTFMAAYFNRTVAEEKKRP